MKISALPHHTPRHRVLVSGGFALIVALGTGAPSPADAVASTHAAARVVASGGTWQQAQQVPGLAALNSNGRAEVLSVSCARPGDCGAGGFYSDGSGNERGFVVTEKQGVWGQAEEVPGLAALNTGSDAPVQSVSCAAAGECSAGGFYIDGSGLQAFVVRET